MTRYAGVAPIKAAGRLIIRKRASNPSSRLGKYDGVYGTRYVLVRDDGAYDFIIGAGTFDVSFDPNDEQLNAHAATAVSTDGGLGAGALAWTPIVESLIGAVGELSGGTGGVGSVGPPGPKGDKGDPGPVGGKGDAGPAGAVGDGVADDTAALQAALDAATGGQVVHLTYGKTYRHTAVLRVRTPGVTITGGGTLHATNEAASSVSIEAPDVTVRGITLTITPPTQRYVAYEQMRLCVKGAARTLIDSVKVQGSAASGIYVGTATDFVIRDVHVADTKADGIHMTTGSRRGRVVRPLVERAGDDGVAVVSYDADSDVVQQVTIESPEVRDQLWGRAFSVVGGKDIIFRDFKSYRSGGAAIYVANEGNPFYTRDVAGVVFSGGTLIDSNTNTAIGHGAVLIYAGAVDRSISNVLIEDLLIRGTSPHSGRSTAAICDGGTMAEVTMRTVAIGDDYDMSAYYADAVPVDAVALSNWIQTTPRAVLRGI